ncbi:MAG: hypothetical protein IK101_02295 [Oscillospiraceae bacterium]|jgi:hypothetical protein|nr:hypothetical protein [Oscillospiraceae bacterium]
MKTTTKAILTVLVVIAAGLLFWRGVHVALGTDRKTVAYETMQDLMIDAKTGFLERFDDLQDCAFLLFDDVGLSVVADREGKPFVDDGELVPAAQALSAEKAAALEAVMGEYESGTRVSGVEVTDKAVLFYCGYYADGVYGIIYEKDLGNTTEYETIELTENWRIFYRLPKL